MKATATAHPLQELIKGPRQLEQFSVPFYDSISVCTAPLVTVVTVKFCEERSEGIKREDRGEIILNGASPERAAVLRINAVISEIQRLSGIDRMYKVVAETRGCSRENLSTRASECAATTVAAAQAAGLDLSSKELSRIAKKGAPPASRAVTGYFSRSETRLQREFSNSFVIDRELEMGMVAVPIRSFPQRISTEELSSVLEWRLKTIYTHLYKMERAIKDGDIFTVGALAEEQSIELGQLIINKNEAAEWTLDTKQVMAEVNTLREKGVKAWFSIDADAVYINSYPENVGEIKKHLETAEIETVALHVGEGAQLIQDHLQ